tara:strand:- start:56 stop:1132 length:1077 start_codon:yes stop_codon:yes gene_type:complete
MRIGIIGYSFSGKTSLFNSLTGGSSNSIRKNSIGISKVPDDRIDKLIEVFNPKKITYSEIEFMDFEESLSTLSDPFIPRTVMQELQKVDQILIVVRSFENHSVPHELGDLNIIRDLEKIIFELAFSDIELIDKRISRLNNDKKGLKSSDQIKIDNMIKSLESIQEQLEQGVLFKNIEINSLQEEAIKDTFFVSKLPIVVVVNSSNESLEQDKNMKSLIRDNLEMINDIEIINCQLEEELNELDTSEQVEFRKNLGAEETAVNKITKLCYHSQGLISFLTVGEDEVRSWTIINGTSAENSAAKIHSDIKKGFIRAETINYNEFIEVGSLNESKKQGKLKQESKEYVVNDGDIINFLFSV